MTQLLQNAVYGTALILAAAILRRALGGRLIPEARLTLWGLCLIRLLAPVFPASGLSLWGLLPRAGAASTAAPGIDPLPVPSGAAGNLPNLTTPAPGTVSPGFTPVEPAGAAFPWETVLLSVWIGVGVLLAARYVLSWNCTRRAVAQAIPLPRDDSRYAALPKCARLREGVMDGAPLTFGAARPTVVLSPGLSGGALDCVLAHEAVHARRRDNLWHYAMAAALVVYWWNPAVWLMARLLRRDIELSCDRAAVRKLGADRRAEYAHTLVSMATTAEGPAFCQTFGRKAAEERIISIMKYKKVTVIGAALSLALVLAVTVGFASGPAADVPDEDSTTSSAPSGKMWSMSCDADNNLKYFAINLDFLEANLDQYVADGSMTQAEADAILERAKALAGDGVTLEWGFQENSGLIVDHSRVVNAYDFPVFYRNESGELTPVDPAAVVSGYIFPSEIAKKLEQYGGELVVYRGRMYDRNLLSQETQDWLDWYLALPEEERLAVSYEPWELRNGETPAGTDTEQAVPEFVPDYDPSTEDSAPDAPVNALNYCPVEGCAEVMAHQHDGRWYCYAHPVCVEAGCTITGEHVHDGVVYSCNGAHSGGACNGSCYSYAGNGGGAASPAAPVSGGHHGDSHHGNGYHGGHH